MQLPVFIHPTTPFTDGMGLADFGLGNTIGFTSETSLCFAKLILEGVLDELPDLQLIACHGGGAFPYLAARFDIMWERTVSARKNQAPPIDVSEAALVRLHRLRPADTRFPRRARRAGSRALWLRLSILDRRHEGHAGARRCVAGRAGATRFAAATRRGCSI